MAHLYPTATANLLSVAKRIIPAQTSVGVTITTDTVYFHDEQFKQGGKISVVSFTKTQQRNHTRWLARMPRMSFAKKTFTPGVGTKPGRVMLIKPGLHVVSRARRYNNPGYQVAAYH